MKLYVRKKIASIKDVFNIYDENENEKYHVQGKVFSFGAKLTVSTTEGSEVAFIKERFNHFLPSFEFYVQDELIGTIREKVGWK
ncbi:LURP-one-related/scramblase family protein [Enterococcus sp. LJL99]